MEDKNDRVKFTYNQITEHIYLGSNVCCEIHFDEKLLKLGITTDISLEKERIDNPFGVQQFLWIPVVDHQSPTEKQLEFGASCIEKLIKMDQKIYIHCKNGHGRGPTMVAAYLIRSGKSTKEAIEFIKEKRPEIHLEEVQISALQKYEKTIKK